MRFDAETPPRRLLPLQVAAPDIEAWILAKEPRAIGAFNELAPEEYARAFTVARTAGTDIANDLYYALVDNLSRGGAEADFSKLVTPILREKGWLGGNDGAIANRVALIYDTNLRLARGAGRWAQYQASKMALPYLEGYTVEDSRVRHPPKSKKSDHRAFDGIRLPIDHWFWTKYWTPLGFRCRCAIRQLSRSQLARTTGLTQPDDLAERIERLGPPVFLSPTTPIGAQLDVAVKPTNEKLIPGARPVDPRETEKQGRDVWDQVLRAQSLDEVGQRLAALFGEGGGSIADAVSSLFD